jgi:hypothetical protein
LKAITIKQPFAWAIIHAGKDIENRSWLTKHRGPLVIHAGASFHASPLPHRLPVDEPEEYVQSALIGIVDLLDIRESSRSPWFSGPLAWVLANPRSFQKPIPAVGKLGLWTLSPEQERAVRRQLRG